VGRLEELLGVTVFDRHNLPTEGWGEYRKRETTRAVRITGRFQVVTREGTVPCDDGWLALDPNGDPYPIVADAFDATYDAA
jgi:hypothetical protein